MKYLFVLLVIPLWWYNFFLHEGNRFRYFLKLRYLIDHLYLFELSFLIWRFFLVHLDIFHSMPFHLNMPLIGFLLLLDFHFFWDPDNLVKE